MVLNIRSLVLTHLVVVVFPSIFWLSQTLTVPSLDAVAKMECSSETLMRFTAALCSWRWATSSPLGCHPETHIYSLRALMSPVSGSVTGWGLLCEMRELNTKTAQLSEANKCQEIKPVQFQQLHFGSGLRLVKCFSSEANKSIIDPFVSLLPDLLAKTNLDNTQVSLSGFSFISWHLHQLKWQNITGGSLYQLQLINVNSVTKMKPFIKKLLENVEPD